MILEFIYLISLTPIRKNYLNSQLRLKNRFLIGLVWFYCLTWSYSAYSEDFYKNRNRDFSGKEISARFKDTPLNIVLKVFSTQSGLNFVYKREIGDILITSNLTDVPWDGALKGILESHGLVLEVMSKDIAKIDYLENFTSFYKSLNVARYADENYGSRVVFSVPVKYSSALYLKKMLDSIIQDKKRISIVANVKSNTLVVSSPEKKIKKIKNLIARLDNKPIQVEISSRIIEVSQTDSSFVGLLLSSRLNFDSGRGLGFGSLNFPNSIFSEVSVDPGVSSANTAGNFNIKFGSLNKVFDLDLLLKLEEKKGNTKILQSNKILVTNNEPARILSGISDYFYGFRSQLIGGADGTTKDNQLVESGLSEIRYDLSLQVTPEVTSSKNITLNLTIQSEIPSAKNFDKAVASKSRRKIETQMVKQSGDTAVIGGIYDRKQIESKTRVPFLADIPIIGIFFRSTQYSFSKTELVILVTPTIIKGNNEVYFSKLAKEWRSGERDKTSSESEVNTNLPEEESSDLTILE